MKKKSALKTEVQNSHNSGIKPLQVNTGASTKMAWSEYAKKVHPANPERYKQDTQDLATAIFAYFALYGTEGTEGLRQMLQKSRTKV